MREARRARRRARAATRWGAGSSRWATRHGAREHLEAAWAHGYREPRVAYALALVLGHLYQRAAAWRRSASATPTQREAQRARPGARYRDPALAYLRAERGRGGALRPSTWRRCSPSTRTASRRRWLAGRARARGCRGSTRRPCCAATSCSPAPCSAGTASDRDAAAGGPGGRTREAYAAAAAIGESVPAVHRARAELEQAALLLELYGKGDVLPAYTRGLEAVSRALDGGAG